MCPIDPNLAAEIDRIATEFSDVDINHRFSPSRFAGLDLIY
jgi:hypothetical protein